MQYANPPKRPVGRPRLNTTQAQTPLPPRPPPASALNAELVNITNSNETTNHFLGAGAVQRPWMRQPDPLAFSAAPHTRLGLNRPLLTTGPSSTPSSFTSGPTDGTNHVQSPLSNHTQLPPYRFVPTLAPTPTERSTTLQNAQADVQRAVQENQANSGGHSSTAQEISYSPDHVEVLDLTSTNEEDLELVGNTTLPMPADTSQSEPILSRQPTAFADLPVLEMLDDFDPAATNEANPPIDLDTWESAFAAQDATISNAADQPSKIHPPQSTVSQPALTAWAPTQENYTNISSSTDLPRQPSRPHSSNRLEGISPSMFYSPAILRQPSAMSTAPASQHFRTPSIPHPAPSQLLTPEHSPLSPSTTLSQNRRPGLESSQSIRPPPQPPQSGFPQLNPNYSLIPQSIVPSQSSQTTAQPVPTTRSLPSNARRWSTVVPAGNKGLSYLATLNTNLDDMSGRLDLSNQQWKLRLPWLQDACQRNDLFFLHLNQLFCMWNMNSATVRYLGINQNCESGFAVLELLFGKNTTLPKELLAFLAGWPNSTYSLEFNDQMKQWTSQVAQFLPVFGANWPLLRQRCLERRVPPMISEIIHHLGCPMSVILPRAIFCSLQKQISPTAPTVLMNAIINFFDSNTTAAYTGQRGSSEFHNFKAVYQNIYAQFLRTPGLSQEQINEIRSILIQHGPPRPFSQSAHASQTQTRTPSVQALPNINVSNEAFATGANTAHGRPTNAASNRPVSNTLIQTLPNTPTVPGPVVNSATSSVQQAFDANATTMQQLLGNIGSAMRPTNVPAAQTRQSLLSPNVTITQRGANSLPTPPLLSSGFVPNASERLLPIDAHHLPDFLVNPDPVQESLHQVCLRQPMTVLKDSPSGDQRLYQYIESFVLNPYPWLPSLGFINISFDVSEELFKRRSETIELVMGPFAIPKRTIGTDSVLFNLRCAKIDDNHSEDEIGYSWAALPTYWPQHIFISINNKHLDIRRKRHNRRDLPIDVTSFVQLGKNQVKISIHPEASERNVKCGVAVEAISFCDYEQALALPIKIDAETSLKSITSVMEPQQDPNDDDLVLVDDSMTISITDPFSAQIFTIPVRGRHCKHRECFDLETFLRSRQSDYKDALTSVYAWQCPICKGDARPNHLVIDEFFREVRDKVFELGEEEARAIIVKADGTWEVKQDPVENTTADRRASRQRSQGSEVPPAATAAKVMGQDGRETTGNMGGATASSLPPASSRVVEIIELD